MTKTTAKEKEAKQRERERVRENPAIVPEPIRIAAPGGEIFLRQATLEDLPAIIAYEIEIARISFPEEPLVDPAAHEHKLRKVWSKEVGGMFVLARAGAVLGWLWISLNHNFLTGNEYATFRSIALSHTQLGEESGFLATRLFEFGVEYCQRLKVAEITGKVHVNNLPMRVLYKQLGFQAEHLTMKRRL